ncbi:MAG: nickel-responsive transcriptional regulator NikR [Bryobacteraceae bacterium]
MPLNNGNDLSRIGIAIPEGLLEQFDKLMARKSYTNRSEAIRDLIRDALVEEETYKDNQSVVGTLTLVYDHHQRLINDKLVDMQHQHFHQIVSTLHVHLDHDNCLEVVVLRGRAGQVRQVADRLIAARGVRHGKLTLTSPSVI